MKEFKLLKDQGITYWAKKGERTYSRDIKALLDYLEIKYNLEDKDIK